MIGRISITLLVLMAGVACGENVVGEGGLSRTLDPIQVTNDEVAKLIAERSKSWIRSERSRVKTHRR